MSNYNANLQPQPIELGDHIIPEPAHAWDSETSVPRSPAEVWNLLSRIGLQSEGGAGWFLPTGIERLVPRTLHSVGALAVAAGELPRQREVGDTLRDVPKDSVATVVAIDHETRTLVLDSHWPATIRRPPQHYTWTMHVGEGKTPRRTQLTTRMRVESPLAPRWARLAPALDTFALGLVSQGLAQRIRKQPRS